MYNKSSKNNRSFVWIGIKKQVTEFISGGERHNRAIGSSINL